VAWSTAVRGSQDISLDALSVDMDGINMKEKARSTFLDQLGNPLLRFLTRPGSLPGHLLRLLFVRIELMPSNHPLDLPGRDLLTILFLIKHLELPFPIIRMFLP
jgi:hypothetical protein